ncbi:MAG: hypothetical protein ACLU6P_17660 [Roseburia intestinalis]
MLPKDYRREQKKKKENTAQRVEQHTTIFDVIKKIFELEYAFFQVVSPVKKLKFEISGKRKFRDTPLPTTWKMMTVRGVASDVLPRDVQNIL